MSALLEKIFFYTYTYKTGFKPLTISRVANRPQGSGLLASYERTKRKNCCGSKSKGRSSLEEDIFINIPCNPFPNERHPPSLSKRDVPSGGSSTFVGFPFFSAHDRLFSLKLYCFLLSSR